MRRIAIVNLKGGTAKTVTATALAVCAAKRGLRVLFLDADAQANGTWIMLGGKKAESPSLAQVLLGEVEAEEAIRGTATDGVDLLPADPAVNLANVALVQRHTGRDTRLRKAMASLDGVYDLVIIDTAPTLTTVLINVLAYADAVLVPVDLAAFAVLGLMELEETVAEVADALNPGLHVAGLVLTRVSRNNVCRELEAELRERYGAKVYVPTIPLSAKVEEACTRGTTVITHAPKSAGAVAYELLAEEVLADGRAKERGGFGAAGDDGEADAA
jgi:chromosome partitioning protein